MTLLYPLYRPAQRRPWLAALLPLILLIWPSVDHWLYRQIADPEWRQYGLRLSKLLAYTGYGWLGFALYGLRQRRPTRRQNGLLIGLTVLATAGCLGLLVGQAYDVARLGYWPDDGLAVHLAYYLAPAGCFLLFMFAAQLRWPRWILLLGVWSFGIYLLHPALLMGLEILQRGQGWLPNLTVLANFLGVTVATVLAIRLAQALPGLRAALGLHRSLPA